MGRRLLVTAALVLAGLAVMVLLAVMPVGAAPAGTTYYVGPGGSDGNTCLSHNARCLTLGGALGKAAASGDTILVDAGTYHEHLTIGKSVTINGAGAASTFVDGTSAGRVLTVTGSVDVVLTSLTIQHGHAIGSGGGIRNSGALALKNSVVTSNTADLDGGGIDNTGVLSLTNTSVVTNSAGNGGGIFNAAPLIGFATTTLDHSVIRANSVVSSGAGIYNTDCDCGSFVSPATLILLNNSSVTDNIATFGGGAGIYSNGTLNSTGSQINRNWSQIVVPVGYTGGGLLVVSGTATLTNDTLNSNRSSGYGGAISASSGRLTVTNSSLSANTAYWGGDIAISQTAAAAFIGGSLAGGGASVDGGSVYNAGSLYITGTLISSASAPYGRAGAIDNLRSLIMTHSTLRASSALSEAGGILNEPGGTLVLNGDSIAYNVAGTDGGGIDNRGNVGMGNVQLTSNQASGRGGGFYNEPGAKVISLFGGLAYNQAGSNGGGLFNAGSFIAASLNVQNNLAPFGSGGGLFNVTGTLTLTDSDVTYNAAGAQTAVNGGGGLYNAASAGLWVTGGRLFGNQAANRGGGLYNASSSAAITGLAVTSNTVAGGYDEGGGIFNNGKLLLDGITLTLNVAGYDGAGLSNEGFATVTHSLINYNSAGSGFGGGIYSMEGKLILNTSTVNGNSGRGGGLYNIYGEMLISASTISGNQGGGVVNYGVPGGPAELAMTNTTVSGNTSTGSGGGLYNDWSATLNNVTIADNIADSLHFGTYFGGGIYMPVTFTAQLTTANSLIASNSIAGVPDAYSADCLASGQITTLGYNLIGDGEGCNFPANLTDQIGAAGHLINPLIAPLALNGNPNGPFTHGLFAHSPASGKGSPFASPNASACAASDERGVFRPAQQCDVGAFQGEVPLLQLFLPLIRR